MRGPNDLGALSAEERKAATDLEKEVEDHFRRRSDDYVLEPHSIGAGEYTSAVQEEVARRARNAGWNARIESGTLTVSRRA